MCIFFIEYMQVVATFRNILITAVHLLK